MRAGLLSRQVCRLRARTPTIILPKILPPPSSVLSILTRYCTRTMYLSEAKAVFQWRNWTSRCLPCKHLLWKSLLISCDVRSCWILWGIFVCYIVKVHDSDLPCVFSLSVKWQLVFPFHRNVAAASVLYGRMGLWGASIFYENIILQYI